MTFPDFLLWFDIGLCSLAVLGLFAAIFEE
jgi:hypothetical protein